MFSLLLPQLLTPCFEKIKAIRGGEILMNNHFLLEIQ